jgi:ferredoxin
MLYIDPDDCIICSACIPECPVEAIFEDDLVPDKWRSYIHLNADRVESLREGGHITEKQTPLMASTCKRAEVQ